MRLYRDEAIVLNTHDLGEADRIVTLFASQHGKIRAVAKGIRRTKSRFGARLEPFSMVDVQLYEGKTFDVVTEASTIHPYGSSICRNYALYTGANAIVDILDKLIPAEGEADRAHYRLLHGALHSLASKEHDPVLIVGSYILRAMALAGWGVSLRECAVCARGDNLTAFNVQSGGVVCEGCAPRPSMHPAQSTIALLDALAVGDWAYADCAPPQTIRSASSLAEVYLQWHIEKRVKSLRLMESA